MRWVSPVGSRSSGGLDDGAGRRAEQRQRLAERVAQPVDREALRLRPPGSAGSGARTASCRCGRQSPLKSPLRTCSKCPLARRAPARRRDACGALRRIATVDRDQQRARGDAAVQLLDQHLLARIGAGRQEGRQVGAEAAGGDQQHAQREREQPQHHHQPAPRRATAPGRCSRTRGGRRRRAGTLRGSPSSPSGRHRSCPSRRARAARAGRRSGSDAAAPPGAARAASATASTAPASPTSWGSKWRRSTASLPVSVARIASTRPTSSGVASRLKLRLRPERVSVTRLPSTAIVSGRGSSVRRTKRSGAWKLRRPLDVSGASRPRTWRCSVKRRLAAALLRQQRHQRRQFECRGRQHAQRQPACRPASARPGAASAPHQAASSRQKSWKLNQL